VGGVSPPSTVTVPCYRRGVTAARRRIVLIVVALALAAVGVVAVAVLASDRGGSTSTADAPAKPRPGRPPLSLLLGFRSDPQAHALLRAQGLYNDGHPLAAARVFDRYGSLEAKVGAAFAAWPNGSLERLEELANLYPKSAVVQLHLGLAQLWAAQGDPSQSWQDAEQAEPDSPYSVLAGNLLHPNLPRGMPAFIPSFSAPTRIERLPPARQLAALGARAERGGAKDWILYGVGLQRLGRTVSARAAFERAARLAPHDAEARVAAAVGRFDKDDPTPAFASLGPLTRVFPDDPTVRFHLGVLLLWTGRIQAAERQLQLAAHTRPGSPLAREAARYLETIRKARS
jgi:tetratricopeptide (TPR) repeat protein